MAYGNWGAFVYKNGERQETREDNVPYKEDEIQSGYWQAFLRPDKSIGTHHATLGNGPIRLCGYKCYPVLLWNGKVVDLSQFPRVWEDDEEYEIISEYKGYKFKIERIENWVSLELIEPDGTRWNTKCGYCIGAGHED